jgi:hypothetical protein
MSENATHGDPLSLTRTQELINSRCREAISFQGDFFEVVETMFKAMDQQYTILSQHNGKGLTVASEVKS